MSAVFLVWSGWILTAKRIERRSLLPFGVVGALLLAAYSTGAALYVPHLFESYATRYGVIGAVFAMISALFCVMVVLVASSALAREVHEELLRIRHGKRPPDDEVQPRMGRLIAEAARGGRSYASRSIAAVTSPTRRHRPPNLPLTAAEVERHWPSTSRGSP